MIENKKHQKKYNFKNDVIFKTFFTRKGNEEFLIEFLKALLKIEITKIKIDQEVNLQSLTKDEKGGRIDIQAELNNGIIVDIEMQLKDEKNIDRRTTYYAGKLLSQETKRGTEYKDIKQVIIINILDYEMLGFDEYVSETVTVLEKHRDYEIIKGIKWYFIELPKFRKINPDMNEKLNQWIAFIDDYDRRLIEMAKKNNQTIQKAKIEIEYLTGDEEVRRLAYLREKWEMDYNSAMDYAETKGKKERTIEIAKQMKNKKMDISIIAEITGLTREEIEKL